MEKRQVASDDEEDQFEDARPDEHDDTASEFSASEDEDDEVPAAARPAEALPTDLAAGTAAEQPAAAEREPEHSEAEEQEPAEDLTEDEEGFEGPEGGVEEEPEPEPRPPPRKKHLEPFDVPTSGDFWLHDDRMGGGEDAGKPAAKPKKEWEPSDDKWEHDRFHLLDLPPELDDYESSFERSRRGRGYGRGRGGRGGGGRFYEEDDRPPGYGMDSSNPVGVSGSAASAAGAGQTAGDWDSIAGAAPGAGTGGRGSGRGRGRRGSANGSRGRGHVQAPTEYWDQLQASAPNGRGGGRNGSRRGRGGGAAGRGAANGVANGAAAGAAASQLRTDAEEWPAEEWPGLPQAEQPSDFKSAVEDATAGMTKLNVGAKDYEPGGAEGQGDQSYQADAGYADTPTSYQQSPAFVPGPMQQGVAAPTLQPPVKRPIAIQAPPGAADPGLPAAEGASQADAAATGAAAAGRGGGRRYSSNRPQPSRPQPSQPQLPVS
ncbi:hypothetical protein WJX72_008992 [[Myrmecia] bisecta]|uniref:Btz domain-containing protein n=1 Tax=[Myrmecia] bisecta TaxID=41462 RepID=A0AAW1PET2_9CHLO